MITSNSTEQAPLGQPVDHLCRAACQVASWSVRAINSPYVDSLPAPAHNRLITGSAPLNSPPTGDVVQMFTQCYTELRKNFWSLIVRMVRDTSGHELQISLSSLSGTTRALICLDRNRLPNEPAMDGNSDSSDWADEENLICLAGHFPTPRHTISRSTAPDRSELLW